MSITEEHKTCTIPIQNYITHCCTAPLNRKLLTGTWKSGKYCAQYVKHKQTEY